MLASVADEGSEHLTLAETADWLRCSSRTLQRLLETGEGPPVVRLSERRLIFRLADVRQWVEQRTSRKDSSPSRRSRSSRNPVATL
jgi:predicted DNA-binding transcriptional regulator AlpA